MKKRILFILPYIPYPLVSGGHQAIFNGIRAVKDDYNVFVAYNVPNDEEYRRAEIEFRDIMPEVTLIPFFFSEQKPQVVKGKRGLYWKIKNFFWELILPPKEATVVVPRYLGDIWIEGLCPLKGNYLKHIDNIIQERQIDIVQVEMPCLIGAVLNIADKQVKKVFVHHELAFVRHELEMGYNGDPSLKAYAELTKIMEINLLNKYDAVVTLSETDKWKLLDAGVNVPVATSFATINDLGGYSVPESNKVLSFVGLGHHEPNYTGIKWFLDNCWHKLKAIDGDYKLNIIGIWPDDKKNEILSEFNDVTFLGFVDDLGKVITGTIMIVPITVGSGIRMKILEAASLCIPFVSTSVGAEGLPVNDGVHCFLRDDPDGFVSAILSLQNSSICAEQTKEAYKMVQENYSFEALKKNRLQILNLLSV